MPKFEQFKPQKKREEPEDLEAQDLEIDAEKREQNTKDMLNAAREVHDEQVDSLQKKSRNYPKLGTLFAVGGLTIVSIAAASIVFDLPELPVNKSLALTVLGQWLFIIGLTLENVTSLVRGKVKKQKDRFEILEKPEEKET